MKSWKSSTGSLPKAKQTATGAARRKDTGTPNEAAYPETERTHRLCTRGAMLESFLIRPEVLTDDDVMDILKQAFSQTGMKETVAESVKRRVAGEPLTE